MKRRRKQASPFVPNLLVFQKAKSSTSQGLPECGTNCQTEHGFLHKPRPQSYIECTNRLTAAGGGATHTCPVKQHGDLHGDSKKADHRLTARVSWLSPTPLTSMADVLL
ncbi:hypothetical protein ABG768_002556 [Culter alburnus]|uniref:Uncharacterized protein n=1 Tax=Culter alburnus TaxID=194366 RepID=A0AAW2A3C1_CULAL